MEIELIQNYINSILQANSILGQVRVYSNLENVIIIEPFNTISNIYIL